MAKSRPIKPGPRVSINDQADSLAELNAQIAKLKAEHDATVAALRGAAVDAAVVFVDLVGSTATKLASADRPENWIYGLRQFYQLLAAYPNQLGGKVIKCIGDEVMVVFDGENLDGDSANFISRRGEFERNLESITGAPVQLKIAVDRGRVYPLQVPGIRSPDVVGCRNCSGQMRANWQAHYTW